VDFCRCWQARRQDLAAGGAKNQKGGAHFKNTALDVSSNQGAKREMGGHGFQIGGRTPLPPPLATALGSGQTNLPGGRQWRNFILPTRN